jgi:hypothetical protein
MQYGGSITNCTFINNTVSTSAADASGGAVSGAGAITNCVFHNNTVYNYGGIYAPFGGAVAGGSGVGSGGGPITNCTFSYNMASSPSPSSSRSVSASGGAVSGGGPITNCTFIHNTASSLGGLYDPSRGRGDWNMVSGGAIIGNSPITNCVFSYNTASSSSSSSLFASGGAVSRRACPGVCGGPITNCTFTHNTASSVSASASGGALSLHGDSSPLTNCTFIGNAVHGVNMNMSGGALYVNANSFLRITGCEFLQPTTTGKGNNDIARYADVAPRGVVSFDCPANTTGEPVIMKPDELPVTQLPPQQQIVHCTPSVLIPKQEN